MLSGPRAGARAEPERHRLGQPAHRLHPRHRRSRWSRSTRSPTRASRDLFIGNLPPVSTRRRARRSPSRGSTSASGRVGLRRRRRPAGRVRLPDRRGRRIRGDTAPTRAGPARPASSSTTTLMRLLFALRFRDLDLLISDQVTADSQLLFHRSLEDRLSRDRAVPQVRQGPVPRRRRQRPARLHPGRVHDVATGSRTPRPFDPGDARPATGLGERRHSTTSATA